MYLAPMPRMFIDFPHSPAPVLHDAEGNAVGYVTRIDLDLEGPVMRVTGLQVAQHVNARGLPNHPAIRVEPRREPT